MKNIIFTIIRIIITILIFVYIFMHLEIETTFSIIKQSNILYLLLSVLFMLMMFLLISYRWYQFLITYKFDISFLRTTKIYMISFFFNNFLPSTIGMDIVRGTYISKTKKDIPHVISTILLERWVGFLGIILYISLIPVFFFNKINLMYFLPVSIIGLAMSLFVILSIWIDSIYNIFSNILKKIKFFNIGNKLLSLYTSLRLFRHYKKLFYKNLFYSVLLQISFTIANYFIVLSQGLDIKLYQIIIYTPLISIISMIPITINGMGLRDWAYITFFGEHIKEQSLSLSLTLFILLIIISLSGGVLFVFEKKSIKEHL